MYIVVVYRSPPFGQHLLCMFNNYITVCPGRIKNWKLYIWPILTRINRTFDTGHPIHVNWLPLRVSRSRNSVYFVVRLPLSDERTWVTRKFNRSRQRVAPHGTTQPYLVRLQEFNTRHYSCTLCYWKCLYALNGLYPYNSIYLHPCWENSNYS